VPITIREITSEVVIGGEAAAPSGAAATPDGPDEDEMVDRLVRRALERIVDRLRLEWEP